MVIDVLEIELKLLLKVQALLKFNNILINSKELQVTEEIAIKKNGFNNIIQNRKIY